MEPKMKTKPFEHLSVVAIIVQLNFKDSERIRIFFLQLDFVREGNEVPVKKSSVFFWNCCPVSVQINFDGGDGDDINYGIGNGNDNCDRYGTSVNINFDAGDVHDVNYGNGNGNGNGNKKNLLSAGLLLRGTGYGPSPYSRVTFETEDPVRHLIRVISRQKVQKTKLPNDKTTKRTIKRKQGDKKTKEQKNKKNERQKDKETKPEFDIVCQANFALLQCFNFAHRAMIRGEHLEEDFCFVDRQTCGEVFDHCSPLK